MFTTFCYLFKISALHNETKAWLLLLFPTITTIPYSLLYTSPCATVWLAALISTDGVPAGKYARAAVSQFASHPVGVGAGK